MNNAGIWLSGYVTEISPQDWDPQWMNVNLKAIFHLSQLFVNHCLQHDQMGSILNITSQAAFHGSTTGHAHYAAQQGRPGRLCYLSGAGSRQTKKSM